MMLDLSFSDQSGAAKIRNAVEEVLSEGIRTGDIYEEGSRLVGTKEMGRLIQSKL